MSSQTLANYYNSKINRLKKDIHFYKSKLNHDEMVKSKIKEQKTNMIESLKQIKNSNDYLPSKLSVLKINIDNQIREEQKSQINNETIEEPKNVLDEEKIEKLKKIYAKGRNYEKKLEIKYKEIFEKFKELYNIYKEQNKTQGTNDEKNQDENNTNK
jgi:hypothetical protein